MRRNTHNQGMGFNNSPGRPLLTEHLKDIDLELELLKRKREMLEQQQLFNPQYNPAEQYNAPRPFQSDPSHYEQNKFSSNRDFSNMYDDAPYQQGRKRQAEPQWQHNTPAKYYAGRNEKKSVASVFGNRLGPKPNKNSRPVAGNNQNQFSAPSRSSKPYIGQRIANQKPPYKPPQKNFTPAKSFKPKTAPLPNKIAAKPAAERAVLVYEATKSANVEDFILLEDRIPTKQMTGRLELALGSIMKEIKEVYGDTAPYDSIFRTPNLQRVMKQAVRERIKSAMLGKVVGPSAEIQKTYRVEYPRETDIDIVNIAMDAAGITREERLSTRFIDAEDPDKFFKVNMYNLMNERLKAMFTKLQEVHQIEGQTAQIKPTYPPVVVTEEMDFADDKFDMSENLEDQSRAIMDSIDLSTPELKSSADKQLLPGLLTKFTPVILKVLNMDKVYQSTKAAIMDETKFRVANPTNRLESGAPSTEVEIKPTDSRPALPYFVKIIARPMLPKKKIMRDFIEKFNCRSIKKHRTVRNLLFIGFAGKIDYDNILAATGSVVGHATLEILPSERAISKDKNQNTNGNKEKDDSKDFITPELDYQINELLTSIRNADEDEDNDGNKDGKPENKPECQVSNNGENTDQIHTTDVQMNEDNIANTEDISELVKTMEDNQADIKNNSEIAKLNEDDKANTDDSTKVAPVIKDKENTSVKVQIIEENTADIKDSSEKAELNEDIKANAEDNTKVAQMNVQTNKNTTELTEQITEANTENTSEPVQIIEDGLEHDEDVQEIRTDNEIVELIDDDDDENEVKEPEANATESGDKASQNKETVIETESTVKITMENKNENEISTETVEKLDKVGALKSDIKETGKGTPTRVTRSTTVTPSTIRTRRSSKLAQN